MAASNSSSAERWIESRKYLRLCHTAFGERQYPEALNWLHEAHNLARDRPSTRIELFEHAGHALFLDEARRFNRVLGELIDAAA